MAGGCQTRNKGRPEGDNKNVLHPSESSGFDCDSQSWVSLPLAAWLLQITKSVTTVAP